MKVQLRVQATVLEISVAVENNSRQTWTPGNFSFGWQLYDPRSKVFIEEGAWTPVAADVPPGSSAKFDIAIPFQPDSGSYEIYLSPIQQPGGWAYARGEKFLRIGVQAADGQLRILEHEITTIRSLRWRRMWAALPQLVASPVRTVVQNRRLIRSMARRDILARYRGSFGDVFWTILNPLLLMATYFSCSASFCRRASGPTRAAPASRFTSWPVCFHGWLFPSPWAARPTSSWSIAISPRSWYSRWTRFR